MSGILKTVYPIKYVFGGYRKWNNKLVRRPRTKTQLYVNKGCISYSRKPLKCCWKGGMTDRRIERCTENSEPSKLRLRGCKKWNNKWIRRPRNKAQLFANIIQYQGGQRMTEQKPKYLKRSGHFVRCKNAEEYYIPNYITVANTKPYNWNLINFALRVDGVLHVIRLDRFV